MKRFFKNTLFFLLLCLAGSLLALQLLPDYYGNPLYSDKLEEARELAEAGEVNTLFYGSSRFYRHIDPRVTDSLLAGEGMSSYNLGATSLLNPQSYVLYEEFLRGERPEVDYVFLEMSGFRQIKPGNIPTPMNYHYLDPWSLAYIARYMKESPRPLDVGGRILLEYLASYAYKILYAVPDLVEALTGERAISEAVTRGSRGYYSLDAEYRAVESDSDPVALRRRQFLDDSTVVDLYASASRRAYGEEGERARINRVHLQRLRSLLELSRSRGVELYFVISPRMARYDRILAVRDSLPEERVIDLGSIVRYPGFYSLEHTFDANHLNEKGAWHFSRVLAEEIREKLSGEAGAR
ncbi:MAG: hypothetical protein U5K31_02385 [Balneolaceae bacterium]|nr:hypothetical protein [Balneolaceae bacterium]